MDTATAAREIEKAYHTLNTDRDFPAPVSLWSIWYAIEKYDMTRDELYAGAIHLARKSDKVLLSPILYPWLYSQDERETGPIYGGQHCQTLAIQS